MSKLIVTIDGHSFEVSLDLLLPQEEEFQVQVNGQPLAVQVPDLARPLEEMEWMIVDERPYELVFDRDLRWIRAYDGIHHVEVRDGEAAQFRPRSGDGRIKAPIPGLITRVLVSAGQRVEAAQPLLVLEAMKMENEILAPAAGTVQALHVGAGQSVTRGQFLVEITT